MVGTFRQDNERVGQHAATNYSERALQPHILRRILSSALRHLYNQHPRISRLNRDL